MGDPLPTAPRQCGSVLHEFQCLLPMGTSAVYCITSTANCP